MKPSVAIAVVLVIVLACCSIFGWWLAREFFQRELDQYDRARLAADILNARAAAPDGGGGGGNGAAAGQASAPDPAPDSPPAAPPAAA